MYCDVAFLEGIFKNMSNSSSYKVAYVILEKLSDIVLSMTESEILQEAQANPMFKKLFKKEHGTIIGQPDWHSQVDFQNVADEVFFVTGSTEQKCDDMRQKYGCLWVSESTLNVLDKLKQKYGYSLIPLKKQVLPGKNNTWKEVLGQVTIEPVNAAILVDNYMCSTITRFEERKRENLFEILRKIVPNSLEIPFHLTLVLENGGGKITTKIAQQWIAEIKGLNLCKSMCVTVVAHTTKDVTHERVILTNYHVFGSDKGFGIVFHGKADEITSGEIKSVFDSIDDCLGETTKQQHFQRISWIKQMYHEIAQRPSSVIFLEGDKQNRLID